MKIQQSAIFLQHPDAHEALKRERKYHRLMWLAMSCAIIWVAAFVMLVVLNLFYVRARLNLWGAFTIIALVFYGTLGSMSFDGKRDWPGPQIFDTKLV